MQEAMLIQISNKIKEVRKQKNITVQTLAARAKVSKGLISQIENNRTIPSLPVLMNIVHSLDFDMTDFFDGISTKNGEKNILIVRGKDYQPLRKEAAKGFIYKRILAENLICNPADFIILELKKGARRQKLVQTEAMEFKYVIKGKVEYSIENVKYVLSEGDSILFDGRLGHTLANIGNSSAVMLVVYCFSSKKS